MPTRPSGPRAGFWVRFAAAVVDWAILLVVYLVLGRLVPVFGFMLSVAVALVYFGYFEGGPAGQTIGKKALGVRVVRLVDGGPLGWGTALMRHLLSYVSSIPCFLGYLWMLWDPEKTTWHDQLSTTVVVPAVVWPAPPDSFGKPPVT